MAGRPSFPASLQPECLPGYPVSEQPRLEGDCFIVLLGALETCTAPAPRYDNIKPFMPLRLKSLELQGYKTFATRTLFEFAGGITAIVGPNGSGKSNIADSLRWVLGEQSYSLLRGKKTEDMIFGGSEHRPRAGMAQATVTFDNADQWLPVDFSEVALARHAFRDGRNEYLLNSHHVRLREINELLSQAGLSERTYTILGQGLVDASLALKADERRRLF
jgi:chromosome segregation protein